MFFLSLLVGGNKSTTTKNAGELLEISMMQGTLPNRAHPRLHSKPLDVAIG
jgi:hypothetical protein